MNATQWSIQWSTALLPPQAMILPESIDVSPASPLTANQLFGFFPAPDWETIVLSEQVQQIGSSEVTDDFITHPVTVEFVAFV